MFTIVQADIKNILRDPALLIICFVPLAMLAILRFGYPLLLDVWHPIVQYDNLVLAMFCMTGAIMPGIAMAFVMLDEKDQNLHSVLQILPVSFQRIIFYRLGVIYLFGFITTLVLLSFSGIKNYQPLQQISLALLTAATAPLLALIPAFMAANKIEGTTITKLLNFLIMLPLPAFLFPGTWSWLMMAFPAWWIYYAFENSSLPSFALVITGGLLMHSAILFLLVKYIFHRLKLVS